MSLFLGHSGCSAARFLRLTLFLGFSGILSYSVTGLNFGLRYDRRSPCVPTSANWDAARNAHSPSQGVGAARFPGGAQPWVATPAPRGVVSGGLHGLHSKHGLQGLGHLYQRGVHGNGGYSGGGNGGHKANGKGQGVHGLPCVVVGCNVSIGALRLYARSARVGANPNTKAL